MSDYEAQMFDGVVEAFKDWVDSRIDERLDEIEGGGGGLTEEEVITLIDEHSQGGLTEDEVLDLIDAHDHDYLTEQEVIALVQEYSSDGGLSEEAVKTLISENSLSKDAVISLIGEHGGLTSGEVEDLIAENTHSQEDIVSLIETHAPSGGLTEEEIISLIEDHSGSSGGLTEDEVRTIVQDELPSEETLTRLEELLNKLEDNVDDIEKELSIVVGPETPAGEFHSTPGWGTHFSTEEPLNINKATVEANQDGTTIAEVHEYDGDSLGVHDSSEVRIPRGEEAIEVSLDLHVEPGEYLLTRDYENSPENRVALRRQQEYDGWDSDSEGPLTLYGGGAPDWGDNDNWYHWFDLHFQVDS